MARLDRRQSRRLLDSAFDAGITHFDTARMYGYGQAESVLGDFLAKRRNQVTVTTKVGILPPERSLKLRLAMPIARRVVSLFPGLRRSLRNRAAALSQPSRFDTTTMQRSLETSLRQLRTDYVDVLLLHECKLPDLLNDDVLDFLERSRARGQVGEFGIATDIHTTVSALSSDAVIGTVIQFPSSPFDSNIDRVPTSEEAIAITHSPLGPNFVDLFAWLQRDAHAARCWSDALDVDVRDASSLGRVFFASALSANPRGVVLFSSSDPERIRRNAELRHAAPLPSERVATLGKLMMSRPGTGPDHVA